MDNITHSAIGALATEFIYNKTCPNNERPKLRRNLHILSLVANNFPDLDILIYLVDPSRLGYLVHHRGHTHTIAGLFVQLLLLLLITALGLKLFSKAQISQHNWKALSLVAATGLSLHLGMDFMNSYGVHPFWPLNNNWVYGDFVFIIEPFLWITTAITFFHILEKNIFKYVFLVFTFCGPIISAYVGMSTWSNAVFIVIIFTGLFSYMSKLKKERIAAFGLTTCFSIICMFALQSFYAKKHIATHLTQEGFSTVDIATSPFPGNFMCWKFLASFKNDIEYKTYAGTYSPLAMTLRSCHEVKVPGGSQDFPKSQVSDRIKFDGLFIQKIVDLQKTYPLNCETKAWFTFARFPFLDADQKNLHDLRFSTRQKKSFASLSLKEDGALLECPVFESPWNLPIQNLLFEN